MNKKILLLIVMTSLLTALQAQKTNKASKTTTGYAITAAEKGGKSWREVKLVDLSTGTVLKSIYESKQETEALNARTGKPVVKKDFANSKTTTATFTTSPSQSPNQRKVVNLDQELDKANGHHIRTHTRTVMIVRQPQTDKPFSTNSAAMAYDKKHERLYYTPMNINQLRYIDLKSGNIYYFEEETFGTVKPGTGAGNQITRMVIGADGNGYALSNDGNHLIRFTTGKKPVITDMGALTDDGANAKFSIHSGSAYGGDIVAGASGDLYLVTANRNVFKIDIETKIATHKGSIKGLPQGFSTNGAMAAEGTKIMIASSESTVGYYRFDLDNLQAEKISSEATVFNASDLANGNLVSDKKKKKEEETKPETVPIIPAVTAKTEQTEDAILRKGIAIYPNPVTNGVVRLSFSEQLTGRYQVQLLDLSGRLITAKEVNVSSEAQIEEFRFPELSVKGNYLLRVTGDNNKVNVTNKIVVQ